MNIPRLMIAAPGSGSGKTLLTCGILQALKNRGYQTASFKCGPDYIDPMFHSRVIGSKSRNLDSFFTDKQTLSYLFAQNVKGCDIAVLEGVMGYYDGIAGTTTKASAYEVASITDTPAVLIINAKGMSLSAAAIAAGFAGFRTDSHIKAVILNQISPMLYPRMKKQIETETGLLVLGYLPLLHDCVLESRHLGLVLPQEIEDIKERLNRLAEVLEESLDWEGLFSLARGAGDIAEDHPGLTAKIQAMHRQFANQELTVGLARDEAFCFIYEDNLTLLRQLGVTIREFSPLHDGALPEGLSGLLLPGGYPELYAAELSKNVPMLKSIAKAAEGGLPIIAECGGFLYLHEMVRDSNGTAYPMAGVIKGTAFNTKKLSRFGYITLTGGTVFGRDIGGILAHEFHYYDSDANGADFIASKPESKLNWKCIHAQETALMGFPHYYFYGDLALPEAFLEACLKNKNIRRKAHDITGSHSQSR